MDGRRTSLPQGTPPIGAPAVARRRILKGGAAGVPVLLTLASRPVLGTTCSTASAYGSLTGSHAASQHMACAGRSPTTWASSETWPAPYYPTTKNGSNGYDATAYHCLTTGLLGASFEGKTLLDVMKLSDDGAIRTLREFEAAVYRSVRQ